MGQLRVMSTEKGQKMTLKMSMKETKGGIQLGRPQEEGG